jgi:hypothetical protein
MASITPLFELYKNSKAKMEIKLEGNKVTAEFGMLIDEKLRLIVDQFGESQTPEIHRFPHVKQISNSTSADLHHHQLKNHENKYLMPNGNESTINTTKPSLPTCSLEEAWNKIEKSAESLTQYQHKFKILSEGSFSGWTNELVMAFKNEGQLVDEFIAVHQQVILVLTSEFFNPSATISQL